MIKHGFSLHCNLPHLGRSVTIYKTVEACDKAARISISKGWTGYTANCEYKPNITKLNGYEIISENNKRNF